MWSPTPTHRKLVHHVDDGLPHFLTFSCYRRLQLLSKDRTREWFLESLQAARQAHGFHLWAWVIMPEHVHLLIWPPAERISSEPGKALGRLAGILADIKRPVGQKAIRHLEQLDSKFLERLTVRHRNRTYRRFWQAGSGYDEPINDPRAILAIIEYIHNNPVRRGLVARAEDWIWSSARDWLSLDAKTLCPIDRTIADNAGWSTARPPR
jgi:putative transposase